jgi:CheY-like chemotaxis protein
MRQGQEGWLANMPIRRKTILGFALVLASFVVTCAAVLYALNERSEVDQGRRAGAVKVRQMQHAAHLMSEVDSWFKNFIIFGGDDNVEEYKRRVLTLREEMEKLRVMVSDNIAESSGHTHIIQLETEWTDIASRLIEQMPKAQADRLIYLQSTGNGEMARQATKAAEVQAIFDKMIADANEQFSEHLDAAAELQKLTYIILFSMLGFGLLIGYGAVRLSSRLLADPVRDLTERMTQLAADEHDIDIPSTQRADEIGSMARALEVFKKSAIAAQAQAWIKTSTAEITSALPRAKTQQEFSDALVSEICTRLGAGVGIFYALIDDSGDESAPNNNGKPYLELIGSYGFRHRKHLETRCQIGEGLVGQCALEMKPIVLEPVPNDYIQIHSGLGEAAPRSIIVVPLALHNQLLGVLEFGSFKQFNETQQAMLDELLPVVSLSFDNLRRSLRTQLLLAHSQAQAAALRASEEELRGQQEELAATNEELHGKTVELEEHSQRLRASEEELRVQAEELQASNEELRQKTDTLNEQKKVLEQLQEETMVKANELAKTSQYKSDFLANMSHELRTPLNSLLILSRSLADNDEGNLSDDEVESARVIHESGSNLLRLINDILDLSKIEAGKMQVSMDEVALEDFAQGLVRRFRHVATEKSLDFEVSIDAGVVSSIETDGQKLEQIATNLLGNAIKFTRQGRVAVHISMASKAVLSRCGLRGSAVALAFSDTGIGISSEQIDRMFQAFEQADASTSRHYGGSGLGLAITRRLTDLLGGRIFVDSEPEVGSTFTIVLPDKRNETDALIEEVTEEPAPARQIVSAARPAPIREKPAYNVPDSDWIPDDRHEILPGQTVILAIEDDPAFARVLVNLIRRNGHRALAAGDGETGLELVREFRPTGVLLDVQLPRMDGWSVIEQMKADPELRSIPVHFVSASDDAARGEAAGAVGFLTKPVDRKAVFSAFDRLLESSGHRTRRILLIDDDEDSRLAITHVIGKPGIEVIEATTGEEGLDMLGAGGFDCIVLDLGLPGIDGFEFLDIASSRGALPPVVIYSARELTNEESMRLRQHTDSIVIKGARSNERLLDEVSLFMHSIRPAKAGVVRDIDAGLSGHTVLIVDDDMRNVFALSKALRSKGLNVVMAQDGFKALRHIEENPAIEIVLMDIMMPGMDGYETTRRIRAIPKHAKLPIIAVTAKAMQSDRDKCLEAGANDYLPKPVDMDKLLSMMHVWLQA